MGGNIMTMHYHFIMKPNPYIKRQTAESAHTILVLAQAATFLSVVSLSLSVLKIKPNITLNSAFKKFTAFQFISSVCLFGFYGFHLSRLKKQIPQQQFKIRREGHEHVIY